MGFPASATSDHDIEPVRTFEWRSANGPSFALVMAVSEATGDAPDELNPLYTVIDPDALDSLFARPRQAHARVNGRLTFEYHGYWVVISATGRGYLYDADEHVPSTNAVRQESSEQSDT